MTMADFVETDIVLTLDSGCCDHIVDTADISGYACVFAPSPGSKINQKFVVGNGGRVKNQGHVDLRMSTKGDESPSNLHSAFQVAEITRPLMSVSKICDQGLVCIFELDNARVINPAQGNQTVAKFQ